MRLFLDTSVLLAACGAAKGASREVIRLALANGWRLLTTPYTIDEVLRNLWHLGPNSANEWARLRTSLIPMGDVFTVDRPSVFSACHDRPILFSALAWADILLTLDRGDFGELLNKSFYGLYVLTPGTFLERQRAAGLLLIGSDNLKAESDE